MYDDPCFPCTLCMGFLYVHTYMCGFFMHDGGGSGGDIPKIFCLPTCLNY